MRDAINGHAIFASNKMVRQLDERPVVLVESDADLSVIGPHVVDANVRCVPGFSKSATLHAAQLHSEAGDDWVVALVDRDLDGATAPNIVVTERYDLEAEIFLQDPRRVSRYAYTHLVSESMGHSDAKELGDAIAREATRLAQVVGVMRRHAHREQLGISMRSLPMVEIIGIVEDNDYVAATALFACRRARRPEKKTALEAAASDDLAISEELDALCSGHDLLAALSAFIGRHLGHQPRTRDFARGFHATVDCSWFRQLSIYEPLRSWLLGLTGNSMWDCAA